MIAKARKKASVVKAASDQEERFVLLGGFNDIFVLVGLVLLCVGMFSLCGLVALNFEHNVMYLPLAYAAVFWGLAEVFTRKMRLALPSIVLMILFMLSIFVYAVVVGWMGWGLWYKTVMPSGIDILRSFGNGMFTVGGIIIWSALATALAGMGHYRRFGVPIGPSLVFGMLFMALFSAISLAFPMQNIAKYMPVIMGVFGLVSLAVAIQLDTQDPERKTKASDVAFWLHLQAAPLLCQATMQPFFQVARVGNMGLPDMVPASMVLVIFVLWAALSLLLNRRALIVAGLGYAAFALASILFQHGLETSGTVAVCGIFIGAGVLAMAVAWDRMRDGLMRVLRISV